MNGDGDFATRTKPLRIAIVGGGIGGLSLLLGILHHADSKVITPHLYESAPAFSEIGAGVGFGPNAIQAMKLVDPRLRAAYEEIAADADMVMVDGKPEVLWYQFHMGMDGRGKNTLKAGEKILAIYNDTQKNNVHRATFLDEMIKLLPGGTGEGFVSFNKRCTEIESPDGLVPVKIHFADGTSEEVDAVIGCDGVKSRVRQILLAGQDGIEPRFTGKYAYRGLIPMPDAKKALGDLANRSQVCWGYGGHLVAFPIDKGATLNVVAFQTKNNQVWEHGSDWVIPGTTSDVLEDFKDWSEPVRELLAMLKKPSVWALFEHPPTATYIKAGKICLLGDCAHASTPHQGAGAGMAIEDAAVLSRLLGQVNQPDPQILGRVFETYDVVRRPRTQRLVTTSRDAGLLYDFQKEGVWDDPKKLREDMEHRLRWIWDEDLDEHCAAAVKLLNSKV